MLPRFSVASSKRCQDAGSPVMNEITGATEDDAARRLMAGEKQACIAG
jgi:hypothetical protein